MAEPRRIEMVEERAQERVALGAREALDLVGLLLVHVEDLAPVLLPEDRVERVRAGGGRALSGEEAHVARRASRIERVARAAPCAAVAQRRRELRGGALCVRE